MNYYYRQNADLRLEAIAGHFLLNYLGGNVPSVKFPTRFFLLKDPLDLKVLSLYLTDMTVLKWRIDNILILSTVMRITAIH